MEPPRPKKRMKTEAEVEPKQLLPDDLVLEIVARCPTIADVIRCAAASKPIRRGILHASFLRRFRGFLIRNGGEHGHGRPPVRKLLLGLYHQSSDPHRQPAFVSVSDGVNLPPTVAALPPAPNRDDDAGGSECQFGSYLLVASRRSLLVLRRRCKNGAKDHLVERHGIHPVELSVCNPTTGERRVLPPHDVHDMSHALLDVDPIAPSSFKLLVAELSEGDPSTLYVQIFSSEEGEWGPPLACPIANSRGDVEDSCEFNCAALRPRPVVVGDTVHWLCTTDFGDSILTWRWRGGGLAHEASIVKLPRGYKFGRPEKCLAVLPSTPGDAAGSQALLSLIVLDRGEIEVWARERSGAAGSTMKWKLWHRIQEASIPRPANFCDGWLSGAELSWFCEGSGTLFLQAGDETMSSLLLDLESMEVSKLEARKWELNPEPEFCPYEVDLLSYMMFVMKQF
ncbi:hypothetical protein BAE44_0019695 [Dichanthelium oligosanthes]|uniref:DUF7595 domain-containing protein n=1 Tax=Dichanthelium oligosanthes TaxID=888268 RepID=A0A1E5V291_9POAL|nr:hypothetical protein BAE44_0019695 [Dichanthelium oligosanthes]